MVSKEMMNYECITCRAHLIAQDSEFTIDFCFEIFNDAGLYSF